ncbi:MAG: ABC transporter ATP-binding protein [Alphaproteobacteria bacterium]|nr:ABC transporter ATP-binding protein [Alphaproteobacteria bacterium]
MTNETPVLELIAARATHDPDEIPAPPLSLQLMAGELALIEVPDPARSDWFADLCSGLVPLSDGAVRFAGRDWAQMPHDYAAALRGRIGRVFEHGGWIDFVDLSTNIMLSQLHHTRTEAPALRASATALARFFGLPGLPLGRPSSLSAADRARAACVRAFLGEPALLLLQSPLQGQFADLKTPLLDALASARARGTAVIWLTHYGLVWSDRTFPADHRMRLDERGLTTVRRAA